MPLQENGCTSRVYCLLQAVYVIHVSPLIRHGHLRPSVCMVDKRLTLKVSKIGFYDILASSNTNRPGNFGENLSDQQKESLLHWTAPELRTVLYDSGSVGAVVKAGTKYADIYSLSAIVQHTLLRPEVTSTRKRLMSNKFVKGMKRHISSLSRRILM